MKPLKKLQKSKKELESQLRNNINVNRLRQVVKEKFYPLLLSNAKSVEDAKTFSKVISIGINTAFNKLTLSMKVKELGIAELINKDDERYEAYKEAFAMLDNETVKDAIELMDGMGQAIDSFIKEEMTKRKLESLKTDFL